MELCGCHWARLTAQGSKAPTLNFHRCKPPSSACCQRVRTRLGLDTSPRRCQQLAFASASNKWDETIQCILLPSHSALKQSAHSFTAKRLATLQWPWPWPCIGESNQNPVEKVESHVAAPESSLSLHVRGFSRSVKLSPGQSGCQWPQNVSQQETFLVEYFFNYASCSILYTVIQYIIVYLIYVYLLGLQT